MKLFDDIPEAPTPKAGWNEGETTPPICPSKIERAKIVEQSEVLRMVMNNEEVDDRISFLEHPTRPFLYWMIMTNNGETHEK